MLLGGGVAGVDVESAFFMTKKIVTLNFIFNSLACGMKGIWQVNPLQ